MSKMTSSALGYPRVDEDHGQSPTEDGPRRATPMILEEGAGIKINDSRMLGYKIEKILKDKKRLASLKKNAKRIGSTDSADKIAKYIFNADYYDTYMSPNARRSNYKKRGKNE